MWSLYEPNGFVLVVRGSGEYDHRRATAKGEPRWSRISSK